MDRSINVKKLQVVNASLPWYDKNIWYRPMNVEPYKEEMNIMSNSVLRKNNLETQKNEKSSSIFSLSTTNNNLKDYEGTNCSTRKMFLNLTRLPDTKKKYIHKFVFKILQDENGKTLNALIYKSGPKIKHDQCGAMKDMDELFKDKIKDDYYLWAISFPFSGFSSSTTISEEFFEFGDITKLYLHNKYFKQKLPYDAKSILILDDKPDPNEIFTYNHIQTEWRSNLSKTLTYHAEIELINILVCIFKFNPYEIYTTPDIIPYVFSEDPKNNIKLIVKTSLDTDIGSNTANVYIREIVGMNSLFYGALDLVKNVSTKALGAQMLMVAINFYIANYTLSVKKSNKINDQLRQKLIDEGTIHPYQMETLEYYQDEIDKVLDKYRYILSPKAKSKKERKKSQKKPNKSPQKTKKNKK